MASRDVVVPDDAVNRHPNLWLGPDQYTLPKPVRYSTLAVWFAMSLADLAGGYVAYRAGVFGVANAVTVTFTGLCAVVVMSFWLSKVTDSDVPVRSVPLFATAEFRAWLQRPGPERTYRFTAMHVRGVNAERDRMVLRRSGIRAMTVGAVLFAAGLAAVFL